MRHKNREISDRQWMYDLLDAEEHGTLATTGSDGWPVQRAVNFVRVDDAIYFHGSHRGEKMDTLAHDDRVSFLVVKAYSLIPSFFTDPERACPATQFYRSVLVRGRAVAVSDRGEKARALQSLMGKLQPEGGFKPITADDPLYRSSVDGTAVIRIDVEEMTGKDNVGQDKSGEPTEQIEKGLRDRGTRLDYETLDAMRESRPDPD